MAQGGCSKEGGQRGVFKGDVPEEYDIAFRDSADDDDKDDDVPDGRLTPATPVPHVAHPFARQQCR